MGGKKPQFDNSILREVCSVGTVEVEASAAVNTELAIVDYL
jgi:hypothetical protein